MQQRQSVKIYLPTTLHSNFTNDLIISMFIRFKHFVCNYMGQHTSTFKRLYNFMNYNDLWISFFLGGDFSAALDWSYQLNPNHFIRDRIGQNLTVHFVQVHSFYYNYLTTVQFSKFMILAHEWWKSTLLRCNCKSAPASMWYNDWLNITSMLTTASTRHIYSSEVVGNMWESQQFIHTHCLPLSLLVHVHTADLFLQLTTFLLVLQNLFIIGTTNQ